jgi:mono/diheme cytochrome c family protein
MRPRLALLLAAAVAGCSDQSMTRQRRYAANAPAPIFANGAAAQQPPTGAIAQEDDAAVRERTNPPAVDVALMSRGRERYGIFCAPCHGYGGEGDGAVVRRGFPHPPSYFSASLMHAPADLIFDVITNGYGIMYGYGARVPPHDRWAIVAYVRALQQSRSGSEPEGPADLAPVPLQGRAP